MHDKHLKTAAAQKEKVLETLEKVEAFLGSMGHSEMTVQVHNFKERIQSNGGLITRMVLSGDEINLLKDLRSAVKDAFAEKQSYQLETLRKHGKNIAEVGKNSQAYADEVLLKLSKNEASLEELRAFTSSIRHSAKDLNTLGEEIQKESTLDKASLQDFKDLQKEIKQALNVFPGRPSGKLR